VEAAAQSERRLLDALRNRLFTFGVTAVAYNVGGVTFPFAVSAAILAARFGGAVAAWMSASVGFIHE
jgi:hypothetical protein